MSNKVLILIDSNNREYLAALFLQEALNAKGIQSKIINRFALGISFNKYKPTAVIVSKLHKIPELEHIIKHAQVYFLPAESFTGSNQAIIDFSKQWPKHLCDYILCWGKNDYDVYLNENIFPKEKLLITGNPIVEIWHINSKHKKSQSNKTIGITTSMRALTHINRPLSPVHQICNVEDNGSSGFFDPPYHAENWFFFEAAWIRIIYDICKKNEFSESPKNIIIRPHPLENKKDYAYFEKFDHVKIDQFLNIDEYLNKVDILFSFISTSQLDAYLKKVNVISIANLFPKIVQQGIPKSMLTNLSPQFENPNSLDEAFALIDQPFKNIPQLDDFAKKVFNFPDTKRPSTNIAEFIRQNLDHPNGKKKFHKTKLSTIKLAFSFFHRGDDLFILFRDLRFRLLKKGDGVYNSYCAHLFQRNKMYKKYFHQIKEYDRELL